MGGEVVNFSTRSSKFYSALLLSVLIVSALSFKGRSFLPSVGHLKCELMKTSLRLSASGDLNSMTVKDLKDLLRAKGLSVTGLKKELIERLTESKTAVEHDYLASPKSNILKRPLNLLTRKTKVSLDENVSVLVDGTEDDMRIIKSKAIPSKAKDHNVPNVINAAEKKTIVNKNCNSNSVSISNSNSNSNSRSDRINNSAVDSSPKKSSTKSTAYSIDDDDFLDQIMNDGDSSAGQSPSPSRKSK